MPEKQEMGLGVGAVSVSKSKYKLEGWGGSHSMPGSGRLREGGRDLAPNSRSSLGHKEATPQGGS